LNIVLCVFAIVGIVFSVRDLILFKNPERLKKGWLKLHLGKMLGAYISATTAFVVVNEFFPSFYGWFIPGIVGGFLIAYWFRKLDEKKLLPIE
jgi:amino acid transporter